MNIVIDSNVLFFSINQRFFATLLWNLIGFSCGMTIIFKPWNSESYAAFVKNKHESYH